ncbi:hypothetical protein BJ508DRAFT_11517 [Ascobolus immersus RN42]|uniref:Transmembrane protein n=1 Tax=Ascobolus immersus RN42 TaxID=1160509 RepID=A0A3N4HVM3_ASCIM|nr:hypothetical protein BJ508DRAFT_11517 [Ascobolus immersus RN42]
MGRLWLGVGMVGMVGRFEVCWRGYFYGMTRRGRGEEWGERRRGRCIKLRGSSFFHGRFYGYCYGVMVLAILCYSYQFYSCTSFSCDLVEIAYWYG